MSAANAYLVMTKERRTYVEPILDDGSGPEFDCWPMAPVIAESPGKAKTMFLRDFARGRSTGVETDDYPNLRVRLLERSVDLPTGIRDDGWLWDRISEVLSDGE